MLQPPAWLCFIFQKVQSTTAPEQSVVSKEILKFFLPVSQAAGSAGAESLQAPSFVLLN